MEHRDYLERQFEELGRVMKKILEHFASMKSEGQVREGAETTMRALQSELDLKPGELIRNPENEFLPALKKQNPLLLKQAEILGDIFTELAESEQEDISKRNNLYRKALLLYDHAHEETEIFSVKRHFKMEEIKSRIKPQG